MCMLIHLPYICVFLSNHKKVTIEKRLNNVSNHLIDNINILLYTITMRVNNCESITNGTKFIN